MKESVSEDAAHRAPARPDDDRRAVTATISVGMAIALGALAMTFASVLLAYAIIRVQALAWPPPGERGPPPLWPWPIAATVAALAGSVAMERARRMIERSDGFATQAFSRALLAALTGGIAFIGIQACGWIWLTKTGVGPDAGLVASVIYALTIFHALHAVAGVILLVPLLVRATHRGWIRPSSVAAVAAFWRLVTAAWIVVFFAVFVV
jgi:heme/copper-type cytochrome/quinol oxidase subunit 3